MVPASAPRFTQLNDWLDWQVSLNPQIIDLGLSRVQAVLERMALPSHHPAIITVAGTNGKGSTVALLASIYREAGFTVGCYTSPHLFQYNERICINGQAADDTQIIEAFHAVDVARASAPLTYFEFGTLAAWYCFLSARVEIALLEVGLGGRLDAVNIFRPDVAVVTSIGIDHTDWLGGTREQIGWEKAGIFRAGRPAICGDSAPPQRLLDAASETDYRQIHQTFGFQRTPLEWCWWSTKQTLEHLPIPALSGAEQYDNAAVALQVIECMSASYPVDVSYIQRGLSRVRLPGRFQVIQAVLTIILDVAHNPDAACRLREKLRARPCRGKTFAMVGVMQDKAVADIVMPLLPVVDEWCVVAPNTARAMEPTAILSVLKQQTQSPVSLGGEIKAALEKILVDASPSDRLVIFGSFFTVAEGLRNLGMVKLSE